MEIFHEGIDVIYKDKQNSFKLMCDEYSESFDEIKIRTTIQENRLKRGWIGDLYCSIYRTLHVHNGEVCEVERTEDTHKDVLLASVTIHKIRDGVVTWEYRFLKK